MAVYVVLPFITFAGGLNYPVKFTVGVVSLKCFHISLLCIIYKYFKMLSGMAEVTPEQT